MRIQIGELSFRVDKSAQLTTFGRLSVLSLAAQIESHLKREETRYARASQSACKNVPLVILSDRKGYFQ